MRHRLSILTATIVTALAVTSSPSNANATQNAQADSVASLAVSDPSVVPISLAITGSPVRTSGRVATVPLSVTCPASSGRATVQTRLIQSIALGFGLSRYTLYSAAGLGETKVTCTGSPVAVTLSVTTNESDWLTWWGVQIYADAYVFGADGRANGMTTATNGNGRFA